MDTRIQDHGRDTLAGGGSFLCRRRTSLAACPPHIYFLLLETRDARPVKSRPCSGPAHPVKLTKPVGEQRGKSDCRFH